MRLLANGRLIYEKDLLVTLLFLNVLSVIYCMVHMSYAFVSSKLPISAANLQYVSYKLLATLICSPIKPNDTKATVFMTIKSFESTNSSL